MEASNKNELYTEIDKTVTQASALLQSLDDKKINIVPFENSWTAAQVVRHIVKSISGMTRAVFDEAAVSERDPLERVPFLKKIFLDFSTKMKSPEFIIPEEKAYTVQESVDSLKNAVAQLKIASDNTNLNEMVNSLPFSPVTKIEILHFVLYHTQRHVHQLEKICETL